MVTHLFFNGDHEVKKEHFNASFRPEDLARFGNLIADFTEKMTTYAGSAVDPGESGKLIAARLCRDTCFTSLEHPPPLRWPASIDARSATMRWM